MTNPVLVLGGTGMIGSGVVTALAAAGTPVRGTTRHPELLTAGLASRFDVFDWGTDPLERLVDGYGPGDTVVNCAGLIKQYIRDDDLEHRRAALSVNADLPAALAQLAESQGFRVIHITTDCVYSGAAGGYVETDRHDADDVYGRSKSLGEIPSASVVNLRCSVVGQELRGFKSLLHWLTSTPAGATINGYTDHHWNGLTAGAFGRIVVGIIETANPVAGTVHIVPADTVTKLELATAVLVAAGRDDVTVEPTTTGTGVNRILATNDPDTNSRLWSDAGYDAVPTIGSLISTLFDTEPTEQMK